MTDKELRTLYPAVQANDMRRRVMNAIHSGSASHRRGKLRLSAVLCAALTAVLILSAGAAAMRGVQILLPQSEEDYVWVRDHETGGKKKEFTYRVQTEGDTVTLSAEAQARLAPYIQNRDGAQVYESTSLADLEALLGFTFHVPAGEIEQVSMRAYESEGEPGSVMIFLNLMRESTPVSVTVNLPLKDGITGMSVNIIDNGSEAETHSYPIADGLSAQIALVRTESAVSVSWHAAAYYTCEGAVYSIRATETALKADDSADMKEALLTRMKAVLDTVR